ncbi:MAG: hypothetical protein ACK5RL_15150 [Acidimicrobiales bacterium]
MTIPAVNVDAAKIHGVRAHDRHDRATLGASAVANAGRRREVGAVLAEGGTETADAGRLVATDRLNATKNRTTVAG